MLLSLLATDDNRLVVIVPAMPVADRCISKHDDDDNWRIEVEVIVDELEGNGNIEDVRHTFALLRHVLLF